MLYSENLKRTPKTSRLLLVQFSDRNHRGRLREQAWPSTSSSGQLHRLHCNRRISALTGYRIAVLLALDYVRVNIADAKLLPRQMDTLR
jgi:hypothetical protein